MNTHLLLLTTMILGLAVSGHAEHNNGNLTQGQINQLIDPNYQLTAFDKFQQIQQSVSSMQSGGSSRGAKEDQLAAPAKAIRENMNKNLEEYNKNVNKIQETATANQKELAKVADSPEVSASISKAMQAINDSAKFVPNTNAVAGLMADYASLSGLTAKIGEFNREFLNQMAAKQQQQQQAAPQNGQGLLLAGGAGKVSAFGNASLQSKSYNVPSLTNGSAVGGGASHSTSTGTAAAPTGGQLGVSATKAVSPSILNKAYNTQGISAR